MWKNIAPIVAGLGLFLAAPAPATEKAEPGKGADNLVARTVVLKGMLRHVKGAKTREPLIPFDYWTVYTGGETYYLDLRGKELLERAEKLVNRPVVVTGIPEPVSPTLRVTHLKADEVVTQTIQVEIRGRLAGVRDELWRYRQPALLIEWDEGLSPRPRPWPQPVPPIELDPIIGWQIVLGEKSYQLNFGGHTELLDLAKGLDGKGVIITGTRVGEVVHVSGMKADEGTYRETVTVEVQGVLRHSFADMDVWLESDPPKYGGKMKVPVGWEITAAGKAYTLDFRSHPELEKQAPRLANKTVVVTGTLKDSVVTVTGLRFVNPDASFERSAPLSLAESCF